MHIQLYMSTSLGTIYYTDLTHKDRVVLVQGKTLPHNLVQLETQAWDVIVKMD